MTGGRWRARGGSRTRDLTLTRRLLWPAELLGQGRDDTGPGDGCAAGALEVARPRRVLASGRAPGQPLVVLTDRDRAILDFERGCWQLSSPKADAIRAHLDLSPTRYYQLLNLLLDDPAAAAYDPLVVRRLRRARLHRRRARIEGRTTAGRGR